jgi:hypothetical protein
MTLASIAPGKKIRASHMLELQELVGGFQDQLDALPGVPQLENIRAGIFNVLDYDAVGNGIADDRVPFQDALEAAYAAWVADGIPTEVYAPPGKTYKLGYRSGTYTSGFKICCLVYGSDVTINIAGDLLIDDEPATGFFVFTNVPGDITPATVEDTDWWVDHNYVKPGDGGTLFPSYDIDPVAFGDGTVTLATIADAADFAVGDAIFLRSGQTLSDTGHGNPDSEINEVTAVNLVTGELDIKWPAAKDYIQEYYPDAGENDPTTTAVTAWLAPFGVHNIEPVVARNLAVIGSGTIRSEVTGDHGYVVGFGSLIGLKVDIRVAGTNISPQTGGPYRDADLKAHADVAFNIQNDTLLTADKGCGDVRMEMNCVNSGSFVSFCHVHEGTFQAVVKGKVVNPPSATDNHAISVRARGYDIRIQDIDVIHESSGDGVPVFVDETIQNVTVSGVNPTGSASIIAASNATLRNNGGYWSTSTGTDNDIHVMSKWVYHDSAASLIIGTLPVGAFVLDAYVQVLTAFDGPTANLAVGHDGGYYGLITGAAAVDLTSLGLPAFTRPTDVGYYQVAGADTRDIEIIYTADGSAAGRAVVVVTWCYAERGIGI